MSNLSSQNGSSTRDCEASIGQFEIQSLLSEQEETGDDRISDNIMSGETYDDAVATGGCHRTFSGPVYPYVGKRRTPYLVACLLLVFGAIGVAVVSTAQHQGKNKAPPSPKNEFKSTMVYDSIDQLRLDIAKMSIEMMLEDTKEASEKSQTLNIRPFYELVEAGLDQFGIRGVYEDLFVIDKFIYAQMQVAPEIIPEGFGDEFHIERVDHPGWLPLPMYFGLPNDREVVYYSEDPVVYGKPNVSCSGCQFWLNHYVGVITADKLFNDGHLFLGGGGGDDQPGEAQGRNYIYEASDLMKELQRIARLDTSDFIVFDAMHGFTWHYVASKMPNMTSYPIEIATSFCGDLLWENEPVEHLAGNDIGRECRHGMGHGIFYSMLVQQMRRGTCNYTYSAYEQFRPSVGFYLDEEYICKTSEMCEGAPSTKAYHDCLDGVRHNAFLFANVDPKVKSIDVRRQKVDDHLKRCSDGPFNF